jgi:phenylacetic acid degradation operon negative regulatory protein
MVGLRLAELREGVWMRPGNLLRQPDRTVAEQCTFFVSRYPDPLALVSQLWDLPAWAREARLLSAELDGADGLTAGFMATAKVIRHLLIDPYLPTELLSADWPGEELRERYADFSASYAQRLRDYSDG